MLSQGGQANYNGKTFEQMFYDRLIQKSYERIEAIQTAEGVVTDGVFVPLVREQPYFIAQWKSPFRNLYKQPMKLDFYVWHAEKYPYGLLVELKYQELGGSVDEKYPFIVLSLVATGVPSLLVLTGNGSRLVAKNWCKTQEQPGKLMVITSADELNTRLNRELF